MCGTGCAPDPPAAVVGVVAEACGPAPETGSGAIVAPDLVLTSAHVVAGATSIRVVAGGRTSAATIVAFDPDMDLAYLATEGSHASPLEIGGARVEPGDTGVAWVVRDGAPIAVPVRIERRIQIRTQDVYLEGETLRPGFELTADIRPGDSGGAVLVDGRVAGVVWARSRRAADRAYAIDVDRAAEVVDRQLHDGRIDPGIDLTRCS